MSPMEVHGLIGLDLWPGRETLSESALQRVHEFSAMSSHQICLDAL